ncbi:MAG: hypothetical protein ACPLUL_12875 [Thermanaerothrix sp.]
MHEELILLMAVGFRITGFNLLVVLAVVVAARRSMRRRRLRTPTR